MSAKPKAATSLCWREAKLGDVLPLRYGKARSPKFGYQRPGTATFGSNGMFGTFERALTTRATLIVGRKGAAGTVHYSPDPCWPIDTAFYTEGSDKIFLPFFRYLLESLRLVTLDRSTAIPSLSRDDYGARVVRYPESTDEQRRIVEEIEKHFTRLEAGVAALTRVQANLTRYRAAVLKAACEGPWPRRPLGEIAKVQGGIQKQPKRRPEKNHYPFLRVANVLRGKLDLEEIHRIELFGRELDRLRLQFGDLLIVEGNGSPSQIGRMAIWNGEVENCVHQNHIIRARLDSSILPKFVSAYWNSPFGQERIAEVASSTSGLYTLNVRKVGQLEVPTPPLAEQERVVAEVERRLSVVEELETVVSTNLQRATGLRQSILRRAFTGEVSAQQPAVPTKPSAAVGQCRPPNRHFARALLSAEIVHRLHGEPTFGRVKHQKIFHLCEYIARIKDIQGEYHREAAGPLDNKLIYANEAELKKQGWYETFPRPQRGHAYRPLHRAGGHRQYVSRYWPDRLPRIETLIELMRPWGTDRCEMFSTIYAAWNDLILWGQEPTDAAIMHEILHCWNTSKQRFPERRWRETIAWIKDRGFAPTGFGQPTRKRS